MAGLRQSYEDALVGALQLYFWHCSPPWGSMSSICASADAFIRVRAGSYGLRSPGSSCRLYAASHPDALGVGVERLARLSRA